MKKALIGIGLVGVSLVGAGAVLAQDDSPVVPKTSVGISVDSKDGLTNTLIDCRTEGEDGKFSTVNGDGTLFMENRTPHVMRCTITIRRVGIIS